MPFLRRQIGMIFQDHHLLLDRTVYDNVAMPLIIAGASTEDIRRRVSAALDKVGLLDKAKNFPIQLSGGEQQRVGIARAVVNKPAVLLADEPTGNLDDALSEGILRLFEEFNRVGVTVLMATHDTGLIARRNYRILTLSQAACKGRSPWPITQNRQEQGAARRLARTVALRLDERHQRHAAPAVGDAVDGDGDRHLPDAAERVLHRVENVSTAASQWYPTPQLTVYLDKSLDDDAALKVLDAIKAEAGVEKVNYLSREEARGEFRNWSGFGGALDMLEENPLPAVAIVTPKMSFQSSDTLNTLRDRVAAVQGVEEVRMDDSWFARRRR